VHLSSGRIREEHVAQVPISDTRGSMDAFGAGESLGLGARRHSPTKHPELMSHAQNRSSIVLIVSAALR
jgi:hypothetical protein